MSKHQNIWSNVGIWVKPLGSAVWLNHSELKWKTPTHVLVLLRCLFLLSLTGWKIDLLTFANTQNAFGKQSTSRIALDGIIYSLVRFLKFVSKYMKTHTLSHAPPPAPTIVPTVLFGALISSKSSFEIWSTFRNSKIRTFMETLMKPRIAFWKKNLSLNSFT